MARCIYMVISILPGLFVLLIVLSLIEYDKNGERDIYIFDYVFHDYQLIITISFVRTQISLVILFTNFKYICFYHANILCMPLLRNLSNINIKSYSNKCACVNYLGNFIGAKMKRVFKY